jgi:hypothetical protein
MIHEPSISQTTFMFIVTKKNFFFDNLTAIMFYVCIS